MTGDVVVRRLHAVQAGERAERSGVRGCRSPHPSPSNNSRMPWMGIRTQSGRLFNS